MVILITNTVYNKHKFMTKRDFQGRKARLKEAYPEQLAGSNFHQQKQFEFE